ncbi:MAG: cupin domain-containing protein [Deltaproteobacteria bacterium]|nr:cupin domain-containing protein [Deltaproteobacteria bacterium]
MAETNIKNLSEKLSRTRESMGLTLQEFADIANVVPSTIQKIETGAMTPSIAVMMKIARGLNKKIGFPLEEAMPRKKVNLLRKSDRLSVGKREDHIFIQKLTAELVNPEMDGFIIIMPTGTYSGEDPLHHHGEELAYCIRGNVTFTVDGEHYTLGPGDCLHFKSKLPHFYKNSGRSLAELFIICSVPALPERLPFLNVSVQNKDKTDI